ncbi:MAG: glycosyltransferase family 2 protein [Clostridiales bacterium]|nr:glycosyltransferase family 2 protein [Clostridiales bacterium]
MKTAVLIPCYNEAQTIKKVVEEFRQVLPHADIYVYDNNSTDKTDEIARAAGAIVRYEYKQGKGNVVRAMFRDIEADCYIMTDGDDTYPASFAQRLEHLVLEEGADMAVGDRLSATYFTENKRPFHNMGNVLVRGLINRLFRAELCDIMTGLRGFSRDFVKSFPVVSKGFEIETEMTIFALDNNFRVVEEPIEYRDRPEGSESKLNTYSDGIRVLLTIFRLFRDAKPFAFFGSIALVLVVIFFAVFIPIFVNFLHTGMVLRYPTLIMISGLGVVAIIDFFSGVILSVLKRQYRDNFERHLHLIRMLKERDEHE